MYLSDADICTNKYLMLSLMRTMLEQLYICICVHYICVNVYIHVYLSDENVEVCHSCASYTGRCTHVYVRNFYVYMYIRFNVYSCLHNAYYIHT